MKLSIVALATAAAFGMAASAQASIDAPVPVANYIVVGGLDWAWAGPCAPYASNSCNSSGADTMTAFQASQGWRIPTLSEFMARPDPLDFGGACASAWFGSGYSHCDLSDAQNGFLYDWGYGITAHGSGDPESLFDETWFVRGASGVPEPATWALMIGGFALAGASLRRRRLVAA